MLNFFKTFIYQKSSWKVAFMITIFFCLLQAAADYSSYAAYNQSAYTNPYSYYQYMQSANAASSLASNSVGTTVPSTQTYQLLPPSSTGTTSSGNYNLTRNQPQ